jgi:hypothetical protein
LLSGPHSASFSSSPSVSPVLCTSEPFPCHHLFISPHALVVSWHVLRVLLATSQTWRFRVNVHVGWCSNMFMFFLLTTVLAECLGHLPWAIVLSRYVSRTITHHKNVHFIAPVSAHLCHPASCCKGTWLSSFLSFLANIYFLVAISSHECGFCYSVPSFIPFHPVEMALAVCAC